VPASSSKAVIVDPARWSRAIAGLVANIDSPAMADHLRAVLAATVHCDGVFMAVLHRDAPPTVIFETVIARPYRYADGPYLLDPYFEMFLREPRGGCFRLRDLAPVGFTSSDYFRNYYRYLGLRDEAGYIMPIENGSAGHVTLTRSLAMPPFSRREIAWIAALQPVAHEVMARLWKDHAQRGSARGEAQSALHVGLNRAFGLFGTSVLTEREVEVAHLLLRGNPAKAIARTLDITPGTARNHLKSLYRKLQVASQGQLFDLFFRSLTAGSSEPDRDPLLLLRAAKPDA
jgi:DNA-binding CsgD family transcriptional regulator